MRYGNYILVVISLLLLVREAFATATVKNSAKQDTEHFWYPLLALPEILAVILFAAPGLVPRQDEVPEYSSVADTTPHYTMTPHAPTQYGQHGAPQYGTGSHGGPKHATPSYAATPYQTTPHGTNQYGASYA